MSGTESVRHWTRMVSGLLARSQKLQRADDGAANPLGDLLGDTLDVCGGLLQELAGAHLLAEQLRREVHAEGVNRQLLLDRMPIACVTTDEASVIQNANQPAAELLNVSTKHLRGRLLLHFAADRAGFGHLLQKLPLAGGRLDASVAVRPRERGPFTLHALIVPETTSERTSWLWFLKQAASEGSVSPATGSTDARREIA